ncbi:MAG: formyltetrahydrofolate deformylase [Acidimicrobiaceae bacterium]
MKNYIMTLQCVDAPGIVLAASSAIVNVQGNILENDQFTDPATGHFCMRTRFETTVDDFEVVQKVLTTELAKFSPTLKIRPEDQHRRALIMVSKFDHCLSDLLYRLEQGDIPLDIAAVVSNHPDCEALVKRYNIPFHFIPVTPETKNDAEDQLLALVKSYSVDFVVLARYMQILSPELCAQLSGHVINIHHSFLPGFKGAKPYHQAYDRGVKLIGATAHFVTNQLDEGPIIEQDVVRVSHSRTPQDMVALGRDIERNVLSRAVGLVAQDRVALVGTRTVIFSQ